MVTALMAAALLLSAQAALAVFSKAVTGGPLAVATTTLSPPSGVSLTQANCRTNKVGEIDVAWSATSSGYASTYTVERATASSGRYTAVGSVPIAQTTYADSSGSLEYSTTYYYRVSAIYHSWSATSTAASIKTLDKFCQ